MSAPPNYRNTPMGRDLAKRLSALTASASPAQPAPVAGSEGVGVTGEMPGSNGGFSMAVFKSSDVPVVCKRRIEALWSDRSKKSKP